MKLYESIKRPDNYNKFEEPFKKGDKVTVQEKVDGSNTSIMNDNGTLRLFSRTQEITQEQNGLQGFTTFVKEHENTILKHLPNGYVLFGEWLGMAKIGYNKNKTIPRYYLFDVAASIENMNDEETIKRHYVDVKTAKLFAEVLGFTFVPTIVEEMELDDFNSLVGTYVEGKISLLDNESIREGIVVKTINGKKRTKIVASQFSEVKQKKVKTLSTENEWVDKYITPMRIQKFLMKIKEKYNLDELALENYKLIFSNLDIISNDIINEEIDQIKFEIGKIIKRNATGAIKNYMIGDDYNE